MDFMENDLGVLPGKAQKQILVVPIIDGSGSMRECGNIGKVNEAMREVAPQLVEIEKENKVEILLAPILFNNGARWVGLPANEPVRAGQFTWSNVEASGGTDLGSAYELLRQKLTRRENGGWMEGRKGLRPILLLISDGAPNMGWERPFEELSRRGWFKVAMRYAIAVEGASLDVLEKFTGNSETIYDTETLRTDLGSLIQAIVIATSQAVSDGGGAVVDTTAVNAEDTAKENIIAAVDGTLTNNNTEEFF